MPRHGHGKHLRKPTGGHFSEDRVRIEAIRLCREGNSSEVIAERLQLQLELVNAITRDERRRREQT